MLKPIDRKAKISVFAIFLLANTTSAHAECGTIQECAQEAVDAANRAVAIATTLVPSGAVMAFNKERECPPGWEIFEEGQGRFIRGINLSTYEHVDPELDRKPGSVQGHSYQSHSHQYKRMDGVTEGGGARTHMGTSSPRHSGQQTEASGSEETRPANVALLLCEKI